MAVVVPGPPSYAADGGIRHAGASPVARDHVGVAAARARARGRCPAWRGKVICVDLTRQRLWMQRGHRTLFGPVPARTGRWSRPTRTGWFRVWWRHKFHWSTAFNSPMPFSQFFTGGQAIHGVYGSVATGPGSHGCVNLDYEAARRLWRMTRTGQAVYVWGRKPGT
ncbi:hypothetical protein EBO15_20025 [Actinomadura harenae]|uniref:L,D-TPase catalytic domain-containing protein n=1 Tax=Actinomadura harenae TaxID=2483351 RepID=A0A3M2LY83_9ACTN|nr:hypothetical protein EBO15_20025 [Actinomadura harenae]